MATSDFFSTTSDWKSLKTGSQPTSGSSAAGSSATDLTSSDASLSSTSTSTSSTTTLSSTSKGGGGKSGGGKPTRTTNQAPIAYDSSASCDENGLLSGRVTASDVDGWVASYRLSSDVSAGTLRFNSDGSFQFDPGSAFDRLATGASAQVSFSYVAIDDKGASSTPRTVTIQVLGSNDKPVCALEPEIARSCSESGRYDGQVQAASDVDGTISRYELEGWDSHQGSLSFNSNGSFSYVPGDAFKTLKAGEAAQVTFRYRAIDDQGAASDWSTVAITVTGEDDPILPPPPPPSGPGMTPAASYLGNPNVSLDDLDAEFRVRADDLVHLLRLVRPDASRWGGPIWGEDVNGNPYLISGVRPSNSFGNNLANAGPDGIYGTRDDLLLGQAGYVTNAMGAGAEQWGNAETAFIRLANPEWGTDPVGNEVISKPRGYEGSAAVDANPKLVEPVEPTDQALPNARLVSNALGAQSKPMPNTFGANTYHMSFGQYFDHGQDFTGRGTPRQSIASAVAKDDPYVSTVGEGGPVGVVNNRAGQYVLDRMTGSATFGQLVEVAYFSEQPGAATGPAGLYSLDGTRTAEAINGGALQDWQLLTKNKTEAFIQNNQLYGSSNATEYVLRESARYGDDETYTADGITYRGTPFELVKIGDTNSPGGFRLIKTARMLQSRVLSGDGLPGLPTYAEVLLNNGVNPDLIDAVFDADGGKGAAVGSSEWIALSQDPRFVDNDNVQDFDPSSPTYRTLIGAPLNGDLSRAVSAADLMDFVDLGAVDQDLDRIPDIFGGLSLDTVKSLPRFSEVSWTQEQLDQQAPILSEDWGAGQLLSHVVAGDWRANENIGLSLVHTMWSREHNFFVDRLKAAVRVANRQGDNDWNTNWAGAIREEDFFQMARVLTEGEYQKLIFEEFVPNLTGKMPGGGLHGWRGYDPNVDASVSLEYATAAYRVGHSQIPEELIPGVGLLEGFLNPQLYMGWGNSAIQAGLVQKAHEAIDTLMTDTVRNNLVTRNLDLFTANVLRGRELGLPSYENFRAQLFNAGPLNHANGTDFTAEIRGEERLRPHTSWADFGADLRDWDGQSSDLLVKFMKVYGPGKFSEVAGWTPSPAELQSDVGLKDIDLWVGMLAEKPQSDTGQVGYTMAVVLWDQWDRLQEGDRFYYKDRLTGSGVGLWNELDTLADIVQRNSAPNLLLNDNDIFAVQPSNSTDLTAYISNALGIGDQLRSITDLWGKADPWGSVFTSNVGDNLLGHLPI